MKGNKSIWSVPGNKMVALPLSFLLSKGTQKRATVVPVTLGGETLRGW